jgi:hypothetical protein
MQCMLRARAPHHRVGLAIHCLRTMPSSQTATFFRLTLRLEAVKQFISVGPFNAPDVSEFVRLVDPIILFDKVSTCSAKWRGWVV